ncbi:MAG TPA: zinc-ribbon domain-containing protein, partial [Polyangia bacterium]
MDVRCERCQTEYEVEDASVSDLGTAVQCSDCGHQFVVKRARNAASQSDPSRESGGADAGDWVVETAAGRTLHLNDLTTLHKWIIERRVTREDRILRGGEPWQRLGDTVELVPFFDIVDSAERARTADTPMPVARSAPLVRAALEGFAAMPQRSTPEHNASAPASTPLRRHPPVAKAAKSVAPSLGAFPGAADPGETQIIRLAPAKTHGILKLLLTMVVAAVVAYAGILWQQHRLQSAAIAHSGTVEETTSAKYAMAEPHSLPTPATEAPAENPERDIAPAHAPVVEPIAEEKPTPPTHLLGKVRGRPSPAKPTLARKAKAQPSAPAHATAANAGEAKAKPPAALAAQGYVALNHRQYP